jgi:excisionase family DNA binding protein
MEKVTIKEAARVSGISATTIRRYIKAGKLNAILSRGRYGQEYRIFLDDLKAIGLEVNSSLPPEKIKNNNGNSLEEISQYLQDIVPLSLYQELSLKHEQLLVQYGMIRAGGKRFMELKTENELKEKIIEEKEAEIRELIDRHRHEAEFLKKHLRKAELEIGDKNSHIRKLKDKLNLMELLSRNAITSENIEKQFLEIYAKQQEIRSFIDQEKKPTSKVTEKEHPLSRKPELDH